jgi:hypothetical protein
MSRIHPWDSLTGVVQTDMVKVVGQPDVRGQGLLTALNLRVAGSSPARLKTLRDEELQSGIFRTAAMTKSVTKGTNTKFCNSLQVKEGDATRA